MHHVKALYKFTLLFIILQTDLAYVGRDEIANELFHVVVDGASLLDGGDDRGEVVVSEHHLRGGLGDRGA